MLDFLVSWAEQLIIALVIIIIIEMILPSGNNYKKYIKVILGIFLLYTIISPIISKKLNNFEFKEVISNAYIDNTTEPRNIINYNKQIEETYKIKFEENLNDFLKENGYEICDLKQDIKYENEEIIINKLELEIKEYTSEETIKIEKVEINDKNQISQEKLEEIKKKISATYEIDENKILIESENAND
ncbi:MAG: stage III sporulation protein AF [Clostridia bacterium]|nr:stage III sporulation protein AF [Clostridia bacterium]